MNNLGQERDLILEKNRLQVCGQKSTLRIQRTDATP
ncbi:Uncharacterised protein [Yersinia enterocolitica]|uniref:Uncharacterized protein n=1 Tax=Yersinia enterocolitica TaxID=630 RepID=A0A9P1V0G3_YEREN|nr:Uncharacterised protein [Yersinia enterocolitica]CFQ77729.1 Uncharacterised protein [Yersinia enterocolitica]CNF01499.1 Uncharacterised protein [Yersinia enterocolitica]CNF18094.1 Uncharacterised protein [Yersinia enterocolitica]CNF61252.1 Uncharacterised protein [Yersinia enterocolitica]